MVANHQDHKDFTNRALLDIGIAASWGENWSGFVNAQMQRGDDGSEITGDIQAYSNIDAEDYSRVSEYWLDYNKDLWRFKLGQIDVNGEFAAIDHGGEFIQSSMGFSPTVFVIPTFPRPSWSLMAFYQFSDDIQAGVSVSAGQGQHDFDEQFYIANIRSNLGNGQLELGWWHHTGHFEALSTDKNNAGTNGWYATYNTDWTENTGAFLQYGHADKQVAEIYRHIGGGVHYRGIGNTEDNSIGFGIATVWLSPHLGTTAKRETSYELFYLWQITENFSLKPDIQWIQNPSGNGQTTHPLVLTLRVNWSF